MSTMIQKIIRTTYPIRGLQAMIVAETGVSKSVVCRVFKGHIPTRKNATLIAHFFGVLPERLFEDDPMIKAETEFVCKNQIRNKDENLTDLIVQPNGE